MIRAALRTVLRYLYKVEVKGFEHFEAAGKRVLIVANHLSFLDALLLAVFLPEPPMFAVNTHIARKWWVRPMLKLAHCFTLDPTNPMATKAIIQEIRKDRRCVIFPEGRITVTGSLMKVYEGPGMIADKSGAVILPVRIDGAQYTPFSRLKGKVRIRMFPRITLQVLPPVSFGVAEGIHGKKRRAMAGRMLYDLMTGMLFDSAAKEKSLFGALLEARSIHGGKHVIAEDAERKPVTYNALIRRSLVLGRVLSRSTVPGERVGVLLPNAVGTLVTFFALQAQGRVPAMLNYSAGAAGMVSACATATLRQVITSRRFVEMAKLGPVVEAMTAQGVKVRYLEELRTSVRLTDKLASLLPCKLPRVLSLDPAVVLFTSGSEGQPKGVVLSHANIQANRHQLASRIDFGPTDVVFNALPIFHSFGLTGGTLLPLLAGVKVFFYPSPLHYRIVPELIYSANATILFGTDTFLSGYARFANPYDFYSLRYVFAGAEKLKDETRIKWAERFGLRILEGYGATETSPALAINTPMHCKPGTVGRLLPGITYRLESVPGITEAGRLVVKGPNVMKGYLLSSNPGVLVEPEDGWYDTGDIVSMDEEGFIAIRGRAKRFAKIGGEMVSLAAVEAYVCALWPGKNHAVVAVPDAKKGEQLVLVTEQEDAARAALVEHAKGQGIAELSIPRTILKVKQLPLLGTGKVDYPEVKQLAEAGQAGG